MTSRNLSRTVVAVLVLVACSLATARVIYLTTMDAARKVAFPASAVFEPVAPARIAAATKRLENDFDVTLVAAHFDVQREVTDP